MAYRLFFPYHINGEYLFYGRQSIQGEFTYSDTKDLISGNKQKINSYAISYRFHSAERINSSFWGVTYRNIFNQIEIPIENETYEYKLEHVGVGLNYGNRYVWNQGISFTWRIGYIFALDRSFEWISEESPPDASTIRKFVNVLSGLDAELSLSWAF